MKHTPGPWISSSSGFQVLSGDERSSICILQGKTKMENQIANARLIAAAPELLEALITLKNWVGKLEDWKGEDPPCEIVDIAINKATEL